jgi:hypothetical protein
MQRLLEIPKWRPDKECLKLIAEDERLTHGLQKRNLAGKAAQTVKLWIFPTGAAGAGFFKTDKPTLLS